MKISRKKNKTRLADLTVPCLHFCAVLHHLLTIRRAQKVVRDIKITDTTDPRVKHMVNCTYLYFTSWNMGFQTAYFAIAFVYDILKLSKENSQLVEKLRLWKGYIFNALVFPFALYVTIIFWGVYYIQRELIFGEILDNYVPGWLNHFLHTNITIFSLIEILIASQKIPSFKDAFIGIFAIMEIYNIVFFVTYFVTGWWIYIPFQFLSWPEKILLLTGINIGSLLFMGLGMVLQNYRDKFIKEKSS